MGKKICLCGSFKFFVKMKEIEKKLIGNGVACDMPRPFEFRDQRQPCYFEKTWDSLSYEEKLNFSKKAEQTYLDKIEKADIIYVINPAGSVGSSVLFEIGYAFAKGKEVYSLEPIQDYAIMGLIKQTVSPDVLTIIAK
jgi:hypothetical protein